ncbi:MAG: helix-turn-helix domain-containing protein, partial [Bacteroidota bacterium]
STGGMDRSEKLLLSLLLLAISLRLVKSIGWFFLNIDHIYFLNVGFVAHGFIGPVLVLYLLKQVHSKTLHWVVYAVLLFPAFLLMFASPFIDLDNFWYAGGYQALLYVTILYLAAGLVLVWVIYQRRLPNFSWIRNLFFGVSLFCLSYFSNYILKLNSYILGPILYSLIIYYISFLVFSNRELFGSTGASRKYKNLNVPDEQVKRQKEKIEQVMATQHPFLDAEFSLTKLSELTAIPKHLLSRLFSEAFRQNFSDFTNSYRIERAKVLLADPTYRNHKIAFIAYECGFNTISSFNAAFKKFNQKTPSAYRKGQLKG